MRFVDVNPFFYPYKGGIENRMHDTARLLAARGHDVTILTGRLPDTAEEETTEEGYRIIRLKSKTINVSNPPYITSEGVYDAVVSLDADAVNYNYRWAPSYNKVWRKYDGRKVFTYHNMWGEGIGIQHYLSEINDMLFRKTLESFDNIISVSNYVRDDLIRRGIDGSRIVNIPNCHEKRQPLSLPEEDFILSLGRHVKTKGLDYAVKAMKDVDSKLVICGMGPETEHLKKLAKKSGVEKKVEFAGYVSEEEKKRLMASCKLFVMPSLYEAFGIAAHELMAQNKPIVCTNVNGLPETVGDGGITVDPKNPGALAEAINGLLSDDVKRHEMGDRARAYCDTFTWENHIERYEKVLLGEY